MIEARFCIMWQRRPSFEVMWPGLHQPMDPVRAIANHRFLQTGAAKEGNLAKILE